MINGVWGKKLGMTEIFQGDLALPVTVVDTSGWHTLQVKTVDVDGYKAVKIGLLKPRYKKDGFKEDYLKNLDRYFASVEEVKMGDSELEVKVGAVVDAGLFALEQGDFVDVVGTTKGAGFAGVIRRHNFGGGRASHGGKSTLRAPGSVGFMCSQGKVIKGKKMGGHMGNVRKTIKNLEVVKIDSEANVILVKGAVPGKSGSLVFVRKYK